MPTFSPVRLRAARAQAGLTQRKLGSMTGVTGTAICNYEVGRYTPQPHVIGRLAQALGLAYADLCEPEDDELFEVLATLDESRRRRALAYLSGKTA
ncbi:helix-turn-helix domain-containing protein [Streptomyces amritsarensis]|uniref:helix-turn-helix domain-containing protein n=1 Tax=Streptomyces amritsarensis TaxID=681158 RepID=UPI0036A26AA0